MTNHRPLPVLHTRLRVGHGPLGKFIHLQEGDKPSADDPIIGHFDSATVAEQVVRLWNEHLERTVTNDG